MKVTSLAVVLLWVPFALSTNEMRRVYRRQTTKLPLADSITPTPTSTIPTSTSVTPTSTSITPTSTSITPTSTSTAPTSTTQPTTAPTTAPTTSGKSTSIQTKVTTDDSGAVVTLTIATTIDVAPTPSPSATPPPTPAPPKGVTQNTIIGLSVAGGVALLGIIGFIVWKVKQKRFSQFDDDDAANIKWPAADTDNNTLNRSDAAAQAGVAARPPADVYTNATNSTVELDPYSVPPLPQGGGYRDDPNIQAGGYYDPYRGPVPNTFTSPPQSHDGHGVPWGAPGAENIPMGVRRGTPGPPGGYDDYRRGSPAPYGAPPQRGPSPGPNFAGARPDYGRQSPAPPNFGRPPANVAYDDPYGGTA